MIDSDALEVMNNTRGCLSGILVSAYQVTHWQTGNAAVSCG